MVERGAACSDFFCMMPARAAAGLWCGDVSGVGGGSGGAELVVVVGEVVVIYTKV